MKNLVCILPLLAAGIAWSQDTADRITVPFSDPSRPHTLKVHLINGGITVKGYEGKDAIIETRGGQSGEHERRRTEQRKLPALGGSRRGRASDLARGPRCGPDDSGTGEHLAQAELH